MKFGAKLIAILSIVASTLLPGTRDFAARKSNMLAYTPDRRFRGFAVGFSPETSEKSST